MIKGYFTRLNYLRKYKINEKCKKQFKDLHLKVFLGGGSMYKAKREILIENENTYFENEEEMIHIAYCADEKFFFSMGISMTSIILNNQSNSLFFHIFTDEIDKGNLKKMKEIVKENSDVKIKIYCINNDLFIDLPKNEKWSEAAYYRIIIPKILQGKIKKVLYLDSDILCMKSINEIQNFNMNRNIILAVEDQGSEKELCRIIEKYHLKGGYFNTGFIYIDILRWNRENITQKVMALLKRNADKFEFWDQDALNIILDGKVGFLKEKWNYMYFLGSMTINVPKECIFIHFVSDDKPWKIWTKHHFMSKVYDEYKKKSLWCDCSLETPKTYKKMHKTAQSCLKQGFYKDTIVWYLKYIINKIVQK